MKQFSEMIILEMRYCLRVNKILKDRRNVRDCVENSLENLFVLSSYPLLRRVTRYQSVFPSPLGSEKIYVFPYDWKFCQDIAIFCACRNSLHNNRLRRHVCFDFTAFFGGNFYCYRCWSTLCVLRFED